MDKTHLNPSISRPPFDCVDIITPFIPGRNDTISFLLATSANGDINYHLDRSVKNRWISAKYGDDAFWASCLEKEGFMQRLNSVHVEQVPIPRKPFHSLASTRRRDDWTDEKGLQVNDVLVHATNLCSLSVSHGERFCVDPPLSQAWIVLGQNESLKHLRIAIKDYGLSCFHGYKMLQNLTSIEIYLCPAVLRMGQSEHFSVNLCHFIGQNVQLESIIIREHCHVISLVSLLLNTSINRLHTLKLCGRLSLRRDTNHIIDAWKLQTGRNGVNYETHLALADAEHYFNVLPGTEPITRFLRQNQSTLRVLHLSIPEQFYTDQNIGSLPPLDLECVSGLPSVVQSFIACTCLPSPQPQRAVDDGHVGDSLDLNAVPVPVPVPEKISQCLHSVHNLSLTPQFFEHVLRYEKSSGEQVKGRDTTLVRKFWEYKDNSDTFPPNTLHEVTLSSFSCIRRLTVGSARDISDIFNLGEFFTELEVLHITFKYLQNINNVEPDATQGGPFVRVNSLMCPRDTRPCQRITLGKYLAKKSNLKLAYLMINAPKNIRKLGVWLAALSPLQKLRAFHGAPLFGLELTVDEPQEYSDQIIDERLKKIADMLPALETMDHWSDSSLMVKLFRDDRGVLTRWEVDEAPEMWDGAKVPQWPHSTRFP